MQIIVLGMHRSGTSAVTRLINMMGAYFGPESSVGEITIDNPKGFWERPEVFKLNDAILAHMQCSWHELSRFDAAQMSKTPDNLLKNIQKITLGMDAHRPFVLKDPRLCILLPLWRRYLEVPVAVIVHRDPAEIAQSLNKRDGFTQEKALNLWQRYAEGIIENSRDIPRILIRHDALMAQPVDTCHQLFKELSALGVRRLALPTEREITAFLDPALHRSRAQQPLKLNAQQQSLAGILEGRSPFPNAA